MNKDSEHLQWIYDRLVNTYDEDPNYDYMIRFRQIIRTFEIQEDSFDEYLKFIDGKRKSKPEIVLDNSGSLPEPKYFNKETKKTQKLFCEEVLVPTWTVRYEDPNTGNKGEALYMTVSAKSEDEAKTQALACSGFNQHILPQHFEKRYLTAYKARGNYVIGEVQYFEGDPRL